MKRQIFLALWLGACSALPPEEVNLAPLSSPSSPLLVQASSSAQPTPRPSGRATPIPLVIVAPTPTPHRELFPVSSPSTTPLPTPTAPPPERPANLAMGLLAYYPFENTLESVNNHSYDDERNTTKPSQTGIYFFKGIQGKAAAFDPDLTETTSTMYPKGDLPKELSKGFSFSVWTRINIHHQEQGTLILCACHSPMPFVFFWTPGGAELALNFPASYQFFLNRKKNPRPEIQNDEWQHWVASYDLKTVKIYFNGKLDHEQDYQVQLESLFNTYFSIGYTAEFGRDMYMDVIDKGYMRSFAGLLDELRIYNRVLSSEEVQQLYKYK